MRIVAHATPTRSPYPAFTAVFAFMLWVGFAGITQAAEAKLKFELPSDTVATSIRRFSEQTGQEVVYASSLARNVRTQQVSGMMTAREALDTMLRGTGL